MEKWAKKLHKIIERRDFLLNQLNLLTNGNYSYTNLKFVKDTEITNPAIKEVYTQLMQSINDYQSALIKRDQKMFGKFLDSVIHNHVPSHECQTWCSYQY